MLTMARISIYLALASVCQFMVFASGNTSTAVVVPSSPPTNAALPILEAFISYSIEFVFLPDFAGTSSIHNDAFLLT